MKPELKQITTKKFIRALEKNGFKRTKKKGGHLVYRHPDGRRIVVSFHKSGGTFRRKTLQGMIEDAGWTENDLRNLGLIK
ncbi:MAG: type II toxin-antitoxin system HicA family toxin [Candidatus Eremiobacteraeota bacterium]|nr:type II toxin-antitoxin system HicA family toxin [Candidatus Eremiobacteraeota bacterium]